MSKIVWDNVGEKLYETGVDRGVLFLQTEGVEYDQGFPWNGLISVSESPEGAEPNDSYADNIKYLSILSAETLKFTIEAYTYPDEFEACDGSVELTDGVVIGQQPRKPFGFSYRSMIGNDVDGENHGYKIHIMYGCKASPSERAYQTINDSPEAITFSWEVDTVPVNVEGFKPTASLVINSSKCAPGKIEALEKILYGDEMAEPRLPLPDEIKTLMTSE